MNEQYLVNYIDNMLMSLTIDDKDIILKDITEKFESIKDIELSNLKLMIYRELYKRHGVAGFVRLWQNQHKIYNCPL